MLLRISGAATLSLLISASAAAATSCEQAWKKIGKDLADVHCFESTDLTTNGAQTTPANNSIPSSACVRVHAHDRSRRDCAQRRQASADHQSRAGHPDRGPHRLRPDRPGALPACACPTTGTAASSSPARPGTRSEFNGDFAWSDFVAAEGLRLRVAEQGRSQFPIDDCRRPAGLPAQSVDRPSTCNFYDNGPGQPFHPLGRVHGQGGRARAGRREVGLRQARQVHVCGRHVQRRLSGSPRARNSA